MKKEFTAYRLGITSKNLVASEGLQCFAEKKAFLYNYLSFYDHRLKVKNEDSPIEIILNGEYVEWNEAKRIVVDQKDKPGLWPWKYGPKGLQNEDFGDWSDPESRAYQVSHHPAPGKYLFTFCIFCSLLGPRYSGEHSWFRLITPEGKAYEFGKYRPPNVWKVSQGLVNFPAVIQSPDMSTMWPVEPITNPPLRHSTALEITEIPFEITEEEFHKALHKMTMMKQKDDITFGLFDDSCMVMNNKIARVCGIHMDTSSAMLKLYLPLWGIRLVNTIQKFVPKWIVDVLYYIPAILTNIFLCLFFGATKRMLPGGKGILIR